MDIKTGKKFVREKNYLEAEKIFLNLLNKDKDLMLVNYFLGIIYFELQNYKKSKFHYESSLKFNTNSKEILINLAYLEQSYGKLEEAKDIYQKLLTLNPYYIETYYRIYLLNSDYLKEEYKRFFLEIANKENIILHERALANYLLSKIEKKKDEYKSEIDYLKKSHIDIFNSKKNYNLQSNFYYQEIISKKYEEIIFSNVKKKNFNFEKSFPIFIVGLPRSGSTLVETILSDNDKIKGLGENYVINMAVLNQISGKIFANNFDKKNFELSIDCPELESFVLKKFSNLFEFNENIRFVDKTLENFFNIDIILNLFPNAKFLHCFRNLNDAVIAIFQSLLPTLSWTHNLDDITNYIDDYLKIIKYFKKKYPDKIMDIKLENLTENNEKIGKKIFNFCNLDWSNKSLNFSKKKDLQIKTTSNVQLREKVTKYDYDKYKQYKFILNDYTKKYKWL
ncbi:uncharacterized protein METZ01_LOCUS158799 [marine metagenome]|uniref:Uncharacterized protein n=1 Tax=marine metagenome TaxID=408172 RepID=A0A382AWN2_9ZZZZ